MAMRQVQDEMTENPYEPDGWSCTVSPGKSDRPRSSLPAGCLEAIGAEIGDTLDVEVEEDQIIVTQHVDTCRMCDTELGSGYLCDECEP